MSRDLLIFLACSIFPVAGFSLLHYPDTEFYTPILLFGLVLLFGFKHWHLESDQLVDYDENLDLLSLAMVGAGAAGMLLLASVIYNSFAKSLLYIPMHEVTVTFGQISLNSLATSFLFTLVLVVPAEEIIKLVVHNATYIWVKERFDTGLAKIVGIVAPIAGWAILHTYRNPEYMGMNMGVAVATAFIGGLIMFAGMKYRKSVMVAILIHAVYNCTIIYMRYNAGFGAG